MDEFTNRELTDTAVDKEAEKKLFIELAKVEGLREYLKDMMGGDVRLFFNASKEQHEMVKGAYYRTQYFYKLLIKSMENKFD